MGIHYPLMERQAVKSSSINISINIQYYFFASSLGSDSLKEDNFAATYHFGGTIVQIDDSQVAKTDDEKKIVLDEVRNVVLLILREHFLKCK